jgi:hypothetical protein
VGFCPLPLALANTVHDIRARYTNQQHEGASDET